MKRSIRRKCEVRYVVKKEESYDDIFVLMV